MPIISSRSTVPNSVHLYLIMAELFGRDGNFRKIHVVAYQGSTQERFIFNVDKNMTHPEEILTFSEHNFDLFFFFFWNGV